MGSFLWSVQGAPIGVTYVAIVYANSVPSAPSTGVGVAVTIVCLGALLGNFNLLVASVSYDAAFGIAAALFIVHSNGVMTFGCAMLTGIRDVDFRFFNAS